MIDLSIDFHQKKKTKKRSGGLREISILLISMYKSLFIVIFALFWPFLGQKWPEHPSYDNKSCQTDHQGCYETDFEGIRSKNHRNWGYLCQKTAILALTKLHFRPRITYSGRKTN